MCSDHPAPGAQPCCPSGPGADAVLTLLLGDSFFLPGNPPVQTKKALKQRFLKLLPCCRPKSIPSLSESKCFFLPLCVFVPAVLLPALRPGPACGKGTPPPLPCPGCQDPGCPRGVRSHGLYTHLCLYLLTGWFSPSSSPWSSSHGMHSGKNRLGAGSGQRGPPGTRLWGGELFL